MTYEEKKLFFTDGNFTDYTLFFPEIGLTITNDTIHEESVEIQQSICEEEEFTLGGCIASEFTCEVSEILDVDITGLEFLVTLYKNLQEDGTYDVSKNMGVYRVDSCKMVDDKDYKQIIAYDGLYDASIDVSDWWTNLFTEKESISAKELRENLLTHLGMSFYSQDLANDDVLIQNTVDGNGNLTGTMVLKALSELAGGFGIIDEIGFFKIIYCKQNGLYPEESLYPEETLYPKEGAKVFVSYNEDEIKYPEYRNCVYEEFITEPITCVTIKTTDDDIGTSSSNDTTNPYVITSNFLIFGKSSAENREIAKKIMEKLDGVSYRPATTTIDGLPYMNCGDSYTLVKNNDVVSSLILNRKLSGVQSLVDEYAARGNKVRANEVSANSEMQMLKGKILKITKEVDGFSVSLEDVESKTDSLLEMTASTVTLQVTKDGKVGAFLLDGSGEEVQFELSADNIFFEGNQIDLTTKQLSIVSDFFNVTEEGAVSAQALEVLGGSINLTTSYEGEGLIHLMNISYDAGNESGFEGRISHFGKGNPNQKEIKALIGDYYLDLKSGEVYVYLKTTNNYSWAPYGSLVMESISYEESYMSTEDGFYAKNTQHIPVEEENGYVVKESYSKSSLGGNGINLSKNAYSTKPTNTQEYQLEGNIELVVDKYDYFNEFEPLPAINVNVPVRMPNYKSGSIEIDVANLNETYSDYISFDMPYVPCVVATPMTTEPASVQVGIYDVSESGATIYVRKNQYAGKININWIAMC